MESTQQEVITAAAVRQRKIHRRKALSLTLVIVIIAVVSILAASKYKKPNPLADMITAAAQRTTISEKISATGNITAQTGAQVNIGAQITGVIKRLYADVGTHLKAGAIIAELDLPDLKDTVDGDQAALAAARMKLAEAESGLDLQKTTTVSGIATAKANLASAQTAYDQTVKNANLEIQTAQASVNQAQASTRNALAQLKRNQQLLAKGYLAQQDVDNSQTAYDVDAAQLDSAQQNLNLVRIKAHDDTTTALNALNSAKAAMALAKATPANDLIKAETIRELRDDVNQAEATLAQAKVQYSKTFIRTPITATVTALSVQQGETVAAGLSAPTLISVVDLNRLQADAYVDETDIAGCRIGQEAWITVDAYPNMKFKGHVVKIASGATLQQNVVTYDTTIFFDESTRNLLRPGMTATADITVGKHENVVTVPIEAVKYQKKNQVVYVLKGSKVVVQKVVTGISDDTNTEIIKGVNAGDTVVLAGYDPTTAAAQGPRNPFMRGGGKGK
jgi:RND family efflux transporter MFP subunit